MNTLTIKQRFIHMTARKLRLVADAIRGNRVESALARLNVMPKAAAKPVAHAVKSAYAAAKLASPDTTSFVIAEIYIDEGPAMKRRILKSRGRATRMEHRMSHVTVTLEPATINNDVAKKKKPTGKELS